MAYNFVWIDKIDDVDDVSADDINAVAHAAKAALDATDELSEKLENENFGGGAVSSVNGYTGDVVLTADDVGAISKDTYKNEYYYGDSNIEPLPISCFTYYEDDNKVYLTGLTQDAAYNEEDIVIPYEAFGKKVEVQQYEFGNLPSYAKSLIFPRGIVLGGYNFTWGGTGITKLVLPTDVSSIPNQCFKNLSSLQEVVIPDGVITIQNESFTDCSNLKRIVIPDSVVEFYEPYSFTGAHSSATIVCSAGSAAEVFAKELGYNIEYTGIVIDDKPTEGSKNAVSSGGVYEAIGDIETALDELHAYAQALIGGAE